MWVRLRLWAPLASYTIAHQRTHVAFLLDKVLDAKIDCNTILFHNHLENYVFYAFETSVQGQVVRNIAEIEQGQDPK